MRHLIQFAQSHHALWWAIAVGQFGFDFDGNGSVLGGLLSEVVGIIVSLFSFLWNVLVAVANYLLAVAQFIFNFFKTLFDDVKKAFGWIWDKVIRTGLTKLVGTFLKVRAWLSKLVAPLLKWIKILRAWYDTYFNKFVKPVLNIIRHIRQVLQIFKLLGFKWAARLDADLARIENKIVALYTTLRAYLNIATSWIQLIVDPLGILRRNPLFAAIIRSAPELQNLLDRATQRQLTPDEMDKARRNRTWFTESARAGNMAYYKQGKLPPDMEALRQQFIAAKVDPGDVNNG